VTATVGKTKVLNVVHLSPYYAPHGGGVETHLQHLNRQLIDCGYRVSVITTQHDPALPLQEQLEAVTVYRLPVQSTLSKLRYKIKIWTEITKLAQILWKADIIHVHDVYWWLVPLLPLLMQKTFITFHGWEGVFPVPWQNKLQRWLWAKLAIRSIHIGSYLQQFYWDKPDRIIYGALDDRFISTPIVHRPLSRKLRITYLGRLVAENEIEKYLQLVAELKPRQVEFELTWVGDGPFKAQCAKVGKTTGFVTDVLPYLDQADIVLATSYLSTMQAQVRGKLVCGLHSHPLKEATMTTFPTKDAMLISDSASTMAEMIMNLRDNPELMKNYANRALGWARQQTWQKVADEYELLWGTND
jgi:glycosyltransferase involved in cell wall biosynthesis